MVKYNTRKIHTKPRWRTFHVLVITTGDIDDFILVFCAFLCRQSLCLYNQKKNSRWLEQMNLIFPCSFYTLTALIKKIVFKFIGSLEGNPSVLIGSFLVEISPCGQIQNKHGPSAI